MFLTMPNLILSYCMDLRSLLLGLCFLTSRMGSAPSEAPLVMERPLSLLKTHGGDSGVGHERIWQDAQFKHLGYDAHPPGAPLY